MGISGNFWSQKFSVKKKQTFIFWLAISENILSYLNFGESGENF